MNERIFVLNYKLICKKDNIANFWCFDEENVIFQNSDKQSIIYN